MRKRVAAPGTPPATAMEEDVARAWQGAAGVGSLRMQDGTALEVRYPGRRNRAAGPDFLDAIIATPAGEVRGAVEVHRRSSDWARHGHGADPRYAGVILHVVGSDDGAASRLPGGGQLPLLELGLGRADGEAVPFPCAAAISAGRNLAPILEAAGEGRFAGMVERLQGQVGGRQGTLGPPAGASGETVPSRRRRAGGAPWQPQVWEQVAYECLAEALGYSRNAGAMRHLAVAVPLEAVRALERPAGDGFGAAVRAEALFLGSAGLLPSQRHLPSARRRGPAVERLEDAWRSLARAPVLRAYHWDAGQVRPENAPVRRVVALAHLALRWPAGARGAAPGGNGPRATAEAGRRTAPRPVDARRGPGGAAPPSGGLLGAVAEALEWPSGQGMARQAQPRAGRGPEGPAGAIARLARLVTLSCPDGYWASHWDFGVSAVVRPAGRERRDSGGRSRAGRGAGGGDLRGTPGAPAMGDGESDPGRGRRAVQTAALIGSSRAADVVVNVLLPLAAAAGAWRGDEALTARAWGVFRAHPALAENWITRLMRQRTGLSGEPGRRWPENATPSARMNPSRSTMPGESATPNWSGRKPMTVQSATAQQGLIALYEGPCRTLDCAACPLGNLPPGPG